MKVSSALRVHHGLLKEFLFKRKKPSQAREFLVISHLIGIKSVIIETKLLILILFQ